ncbi:unnamed protein product, partial [Ectocarpus sp. 8 AP-2014]
DGAGSATWDGESGVREDGAALEIFLTRLVVSHGSENKGAFTTGPLVPLQPGDPEAEVELPLWVEEGPTFQGLQLLPDQALPVDIASEVLHSGGLAALADLQGSYAEAFSRGPEAVEFLGRKVDELWQLEDSPGAALSGGVGAGEGRQARFYTRTAVVFWPKAKRHAVQLDALAAGHRCLARAREQVSLLDDTPPRPAAVRLMTADVVALARQPDRWIRDEGEADLVFECLHRSEDPVAACRAIDAICSGMSDPRFALRLPSCRPRSTATGGGGGGGVPSTTTVTPPLDDDTPLVPVTMLFSRVFSLLDGLDCWRLMSPQLRRLISLNPSAFAGAVIARAAIHSSRSGGGGGDGGIDVGGSSPGWEGRHAGDGSALSSSSSSSSASSSASSSRCSSPASCGQPASKRPCFALAGDKMTSLNPPAEGKKSGVDSSSGSAAAAAAGVSADSWRAVAGDVLASAMPEVARGRMQGVRGCCAVADRSCSSGAVLGCDAAYSPLPLMVRALQDVAGDIAAARMVRDTFSWVVRGERDLEEAPGATLVERERRLDQLGSLVWTLGDLRRS